MLAGLLAEGTIKPVVTRTCPPRPAAPPPGTLLCVPVPLLLHSRNYFTLPLSPSLSLVSLSLSPSLSLSLPRSPSLYLSNAHAAPPHHPPLSAQLLNVRHNRRARADRSPPLPLLPFPYCCPYPCPYCTPPLFTLSLLTFPSPQPLQKPPPVRPASLAPPVDRPPARPLTHSLGAIPSWAETHRTVGKAVIQAHPRPAPPRPAPPRAPRGGCVAAWCRLRDGCERRGGDRCGRASRRATTTTWWAPRASGRPGRGRVGDLDTWPVLSLGDSDTCPILAPAGVGAGRGRGGRPEQHGPR